MRFGLAQASRRFDRPSAIARVLDIAIAGVATAFLLAPLLAILAAGLQADLGRILADPAFLAALLRSLVIAFSAALLGLALSVCLALGASGAGRGGGRFLALSGSLVLVVPPIVIGAGWFLTLREVGDVALFAPAVVVIGNAILVVPYATRILSPEIAAIARRHGRLADGLGLSGLARLRHVEWPALRRPLALAGAFGMAVSLGDLGVVALFGNSDLVTLPYLLLQRMGSYRSTDAEGIALLLALLCLGLILLAERGLGAERRPNERHRTRRRHLRARNKRDAVRSSGRAGRMAGRHRPLGRGEIDPSRHRRRVPQARFRHGAPRRARHDGPRAGERPISMVFQDDNLFPHLSAERNVALGISPTWRLPEAALARARDALTRVGLGALAGRLPGELSGGERQRVALARAFLRERPILALDEPFAALGPALRGEMLDLLDRLRTEAARPPAIVMVTHHPNDALGHADRVAFLEAGRIVLSGTPDEILSGRHPRVAAYLGATRGSEP